jgi:MoaA/NifB/PqqE/SkfB family radical SAM enzyme
VAGTSSITLSLDGLEPAHNWLRGNDRKFNRPVKALALIVSSKYLTYDVITCVNQKNIYELEKMNCLALKGEASDFSSKNLMLDRKLLILRGLISRQLCDGKKSP